MTVSSGAITSGAGNCLEHGSFKRRRSAGSDCARRPTGLLYEGVYSQDFEGHYLMVRIPPAPPQRSCPQQRKVCPSRHQPCGCSLHSESPNFHAGGGNELLAAGSDR